jgi:hypothetical protein
MPSIEQEHCSQCDEVGPLLACDDSDGRDKSTANKPRYDCESRSHRGARERK